MADDNGQDVIRRCLKDAIAAESSFESQLEAFAKEGENLAARRLFERHAGETRVQRETLEARLRQLGDSPSTMKSMMAHMFSFASKAPSLGHDEAERTTQNLMAAYTVEQFEVAMYESLAIAAETIGDLQTARIARDIQVQEERTARLVWDMIGPSAKRAVAKWVGEHAHL